MAGLVECAHETCHHKQRGYLPNLQIWVSSLRAVYQTALKPFLETIFLTSRLITPHQSGNYPYMLRCKNTDDLAS